MTAILGPNGSPAITIEAERAHPQRALGRAAGRQNADNEELYLTIIDAGLTALLKEDTPEDIGEKIYENIAGFVEGRAEVLAKIEETVPMMFLTKAQTARVEALPRNVRRSWLSEYRKGAKQWHKRGGKMIVGNRPVLPVIPGDEPTV